MASYKLMKIKTFRADTPTDLERQINEWIDDKGQFPTFEVVSIDFKPLDNLNTVSFYGSFMVVL